MPKFKEGDEVITLYTFPGDRPEDLAFKRKEILTILGTTKDPNWLRARHPSGRVGLIPYNYVSHDKSAADSVSSSSSSLNAQWFHGQISRDEAERLLQNHEDGTYLVRESVRYSGDYTLGVIFGGEVSHYRIHKTEKGFFVDEEEFFPSIKALISHYSQCADGLCCRLTKYIVCTHQQQLIALKQGGWVKRRQDLILLDKIGSGEFGEVRKGTFEGKSVAVKCFKKAVNVSEERLFTYEASVMMSLKHDNLVTFVGLINDLDQVFLLTEFMENGSLVNYLRSRGRAVISKEDQLKFASDTCRGMTYLEQKGLVHRDLAARNVLLSFDLTAKVADFGLAKQSSDNDQPKSSSNKAASADGSDATNRIPLKWTAPEAIRKYLFTNKSDVWSFGVLLWEIYSFGRMPYPRLLANQVLRNLELGYRMESPEECQVEVYNLMKACWDIDPKQRPSFSQISFTLSELSHKMKISQSTSCSSSARESESQNSLITVPSLNHQSSMNSLPRRFALETSL